MKLCLQRNLIPGFTLLTVVLLMLVIVNISACKNENASSIMVLVDLSGTWFNKKNTETNRNLLVDVAHSVADAADQYPRPVDIRYLRIGRKSYMNAPLCVVRYMPKLFAGGCDKAGKTIYKKDHAQCGLNGYLAEDCVEFILSRKSEPQTDLSGAFATVAKFSQSQRYNKKSIVVLSDMIEDRTGPMPGRPDLKGFHVIILYRHLNNNSPDLTDTNLMHWDNWFKEAGVAKVTIIPGMASSRDLLTQYLLQDVDG